MTLDFISQAQYGRYIAERQAQYKTNESGSGPTYYQTKKSQISQLFSKAVVSEASALLGGVKPNKMERFAKELGI
ncbi:hypothetical protein ACT3TQ_05175 [Halomonas sp. AOP12-C2-37]|uniref:hypothetical protein n=1 Tax=unclassified Halomonas TaxID=2609666 RepID=UPI003F92174E